MLEMSSTTTLAEKVMQARGLTSQSQLARALKTSPQRVSNWWLRGSECDLDMAAQMAEMAGLPVAPEVLRIAAARVKSARARQILYAEAARLAA